MEDRLDALERTLRILIARNIVMDTALKRLLVRFPEVAATMMEVPARLDLPAESGLAPYVEAAADDMRAWVISTFPELGPQGPHRTP